MEVQEQKPKRTRRINADRIVLDGSSVDFIKSVGTQIEGAFGGIIKLTYKEIANFVLQSRAELLTSGELVKVKEKYFDEVRAAQWALQKLKEAKESGKELSLTDVLKKIQTPIVREKQKPKASKIKLEKTDNGGSHARTGSSSGESVNVLK